MAITFKCPHCKVKMTLPDKFAGVSAACPACGQQVVIPGEPPAQQVKKGAPAGGELSDWYRKMTGDDSAEKRSALDELHRDTETDVSEVVTRWEENDNDEVRESAGRSTGRRPDSPSSRSAAPPTYSAPPQRRSSGRPPQSGHREAPPSKSPMGLIFAGFAVVLLLGGVGAFFMFGDDKGGNGPDVPSFEPGVTTPGSVSGDSSTGGTATAQSTPTPTPTPTKTLSPEEQAQRDLDYGNDAMGRLDYKAAVDYFKKYLEFKPDSEEVWNKLITCHERLRENDKVLETIEAAIKALGDKKELWVKLAEIHTQSENYDKAFEAYDKVVLLSDAGDKQSVLEEVFFLAVSAGTARQSKPYLDKGWAYLQQLKSMVDQETYDLYKENLKNAYGEIGQQAPF